MNGEGNEKSNHAARRMSSADAGEECQERENQGGEGGQQENDVVENADYKRKIKS